MADATTTTSTDAPVGETLYQCSMHPQIVDDEPGQCPICAMDLQPVEKIEAAGIPGRAPVRLTDQQLQLINLVTAPVLREPVTLRKRVPGVLAHDSGRVFTVAAWTGGRIEELYVDETEMDIDVGDPLYRLYSPELYAAMEDLLLIGRQGSPTEGLVRSVRFRLEQMGLTAAQIDALAGRTSPPDSIDILSRVAGKVMMKHLQLGQYVREGEKLYEVVDLSELWLIAEIYQSQLPAVSVGQRVAMHLPENPAQTYAGTIDRIEHHIDPATRTARLRIVFDSHGGSGAHQNPHGLLPDMWMTALLETDLGQQLTIPRSALFNTGRRQYVFVEHEPGLFVPRLIATGPRAGGRIVVRAGLEAGEVVATEGTFLLDSESLLKASASGSEELASSSPDAGEATPHNAAPSGFSAEAKTTMDALRQDYFDWSTALFNDRTEAACGAVRQLRQRLAGLLAEPNRPAVGLAAWRSWVSETASQLDALGEDADLQAQRIAFGELSQRLQTLSETIPELRPRRAVRSKLSHVA